MLKEMFALSATEVFSEDFFFQSPDLLSIVFLRLFQLKQI